MKKKALVFWENHRHSIRTALAFLIFGAVYLLVVKLTPLRIPCPIYKTTGLYCPGCGISRFFVELAGLRFVSAVRQNLAVAVLMPVWAVVTIVEFWLAPKALRRDSKLVSALTWGSLIFVVIFGILRNIPGFEWLLPTI